MQFRPVFIPKCVTSALPFDLTVLIVTHRRGRATIAEKEAISETTEEALKRKELEAEERRKQSHDMVAESIKRELLESS